MLEKTNGVVLRSIKYGESSLVVTVFTSDHGVQAYMVKGVRSAKKGQNRAALFQPATLLDMVVYQQPQKNIQYIREFQLAYVYSDIQVNVVKSSIALFSVEILLRLLPEHAPAPGLFHFAKDYFITLDKSAIEAVANFPLFFVVRCSQLLGYELNGSYSEQTPYLNMEGGGFSGNLPSSMQQAGADDARMLDWMLKAKSYKDLAEAAMNGAQRLRLIDWYVSFLRHHTEHMGDIKSLQVLRTILY